ncbi:MAG: hypothetical protein ACXW0M_12800, partial [Methylosarcina sp.]
FLTVSQNDRKPARKRVFAISAPYRFTPFPRFFKLVLSYRLPLKRLNCPAAGKDGYNLIYSQSPKTIAPRSRGKSLP